MFAISSAWLFLLDMHYRRRTITESTADLCAISTLVRYCFEILTQNLTTAQQKNDQGAQQRLQLIGSLATRAIQELQPPEVRFVNALLQSEYPNQTRELLERNRPALVPEFIQWLQALTGDLRQDGRAEAADRWLKIIDQAKELSGSNIPIA